VAAPAKDRHPGRRTLLPSPLNTAVTAGCTRRPDPGTLRCRIGTRTWSLTADACGVCLNPGAAHRQSEPRRQEVLTWRPRTGQPGKTAILSATKSGESSTLVSVSWRQAGVPVPGGPPKAEPGAGRRRAAPPPGFIYGRIQQWIRSGQIRAFRISFVRSRRSHRPLPYASPHRRTRVPFRRPGAERGNPGAPAGFTASPPGDERCGHAGPELDDMHAVINLGRRPAPNVRRSARLMHPPPPSVEPNLNGLIGAPRSRRAV
jgi:hypothetical protein